MGEGQDPGKALAPLPLTAITTKMSGSVDRYSQTMWLSLASWMAANQYTAARAQQIADEVEHRLHVMDCSYGQAIASVWDDIKAGRWRPREHG